MERKYIIKVRDEAVCREMKNLENVNAEKNMKERIL